MSEHKAANGWRLVASGYWQSEATQQAPGVLVRTSIPMTRDGAPSAIVAPEARAFLRVPMWWRFDPEGFEDIVPDILWRPAGYTLRRATEHAAAHAADVGLRAADCAECLRLRGPETELSLAEVCAELARLRSEVGDYMHIAETAEAEAKGLRAQVAAMLAAQGAANTGSVDA